MSEPLEPVPAPAATAEEGARELKTMTDPVGERPGWRERVYIFVIGHPRYRQRSTIEMPARARAYIYSWVVVGALALWLTLWLDWGEPVHRWWLLALFGVYNVFDRNLQFSLFRGDQGVGVRLEEGLLVAMALLFPPWAVVLAFLAGGLITILTRDTALIRSTFNNGQLTAIVALSLGVMRLIGLHPLQPFGLRQLLAVLAGALVFFFCSNVAVATVVALVRQRPWLQEVRADFSWPVVYFFLSSLAIGILAGVVALYSRWALLVALPAALMLVISLRDRTSAITERERMLDLLTASRELHAAVEPEAVEATLVETGKRLMRCHQLRIAAEPAPEPKTRERRRDSISYPMQGELAGQYLVAAEKIGTDYWSVADQRMIEGLALTASSAMTNALVFQRVESERRKLSDILNFSSDAIIVVGADGRVTGWNPAMTALVGLDEVQALGRSVTELAASEPRFTVLFATGPAAPAAEVIAIEHEQRSQELSVARSLLPDGSALAVVRDETARLELERLNAEREAERLRSELVSMVSHELRTPLTSIIGFSQFLLKREVERADAERYLETIYNEAKRLAELLNDFLDLQRVKEGRFTMEMAPFDLGATAAEVVALFAQQSTTPLHLDAPPQIMAYGDRTRIRQVIANLVSNAIKYSPQGGDIHVRVARLEDRARLEVEDHGLGIPPESHDSLFTKFYRVSGEERKAIGGTGLGLALCKEIIDAHGGSIGFESEQGQGSLFWFEIGFNDEIGSSASPSRP